MDIKEILKNRRDLMNRVFELKRKLASTDYQAIKYAEGAISEEEYAPIKVQRHAWRDEINESESQLNEINKELNNGTL